MPAPGLDRNEVDWFRSEQPMRRALVAELQRLKRRSRSRWWLILLIAAALTAGVLHKRAKKMKFHDASVVLAIEEEGSLADYQSSLLPVQELRDYILTVLLSNAVLEPLIEEYDFYPFRRKQGMDVALTEFRELFSVGVHRNFFLYGFDVDEARSARVEVTFTDTDPDWAWEMVNRLANLIIEEEAKRRLAVVQQLAAEAKEVLDKTRAQLEDLQQQVVDHGLKVARAEAAGRTALASALRFEMAELQLKLHNENTLILNLTTQANADEMGEAIDRAGLGLRFSIAAEHKPLEDPVPPLFMQILVGAVVFGILMPVIAIFVGAFDTRVHDREDAERVGLLVLGHVPGFPGDRVGSLVDRGLASRRVTS